MQFHISEDKIEKREEEKMCVFLKCIYFGHLHICSYYVQFVLSITKIAYFTNLIDFLCAYT